MSSTPSQSSPIHYASDVVSTLSQEGLSVDSFVSGDSNLSQETVASFGEEWEHFNRFEDDELRDIGGDYFSLLPTSVCNGKSLALDVGCGSGRWTRLIAPKLGWVEAVDPSSAVFVALQNCRDLNNVRVCQASVDNLPFHPGSFDLVFSLGVLHHVPDTAAAIRKCADMVKPGGLFLVYLYYSLDNRGAIYRSLFFAANAIRLVICRLPGFWKQVVCDAIAGLVYWPMAKLAAVIELAAGRDVAERVPLNYYRKTRFQIMRNDSRDRFGTPLEQRFSRPQIQTMLEEAGLDDIQFSPAQPFWVALAKKPAH